MYWWEKAALAARAYSAKTGKGTRRFGLITTNSLRPDLQPPRAGAASERSEETALVVVRNPRPPVG